MKRFLFALATSAVLLAGCSAQGPGNSDATQNGAPTAQADITLQNFTVVPGTVVVNAGQTVNVLNLDAASHTVHSDTGLFETSLIGQDKTATFTAPAEPGSYPFHCEPHPSLKGTLVVQ